MIKSATREEFASSLTDLKEDSFAKTFLAKCDMMDKWDHCMGYWINDKVAGAIVITLSKREPVVANLQLLHTFYEYRGNGIAKLLCIWGINHAIAMGARYFRVSAEFDAVPFYEKVGFKFVCKQKSAKLSMFRLTSSIISENDFEPDDYIWKAMNRKGKGGCVECYVQLKTATLL